MSRFDELMAALRSNVDPESDMTVYDDLTASYQDAIGGAAASSAAKDEQIAALQGEVNRLKAANYDLLTAASAKISDDDTPSDDDEAEPDEEDGYDDTDELFDKE